MTEKKDSASGSASPTGDRKQASASGSASPSTAGLERQLNEASDLLEKARDDACGPSASIGRFGRGRERDDMKKIGNDTSPLPLIQWDEDFATNRMVCRVFVPYSWMLEASHFRRKLQLWWWLTRLAWSIPK